jgi:hypothetical protein
MNFRCREMLTELTEQLTVNNLLLIIQTFDLTFLNRESNARHILGKGKMNNAFSIMKNIY